MEKNKNVLVVGAGGFIGGHLVKKLLDNGNNVIASDIKPKEYWFQDFDKAKNFYSTDMKNMQNCIKVTEGVDYVFNMACNMGGMGFIENNKAECMQSVLINTNLLIACKDHGIKKYFFSSSACAYNISMQQNTFIEGLKEKDAYPADPEDGYGWEKLFSERMCRHFMEDYGIQVRIARYHNIYGPFGTYDGGREKAPAAICRKIASVGSGESIDCWGDGEQTRSFLYIDDCIEATRRLMDSECKEVINIGSEEMVSINQLIDITSKIADKEIVVNHIDGPLGVRGRNSQNDKIRKILDWDYEYSLEEGIKKTYAWISYQVYKKNEVEEQVLEPSLPERY